MNTQSNDSRPAFGQLVEECRKRGICRSVAFELAREGIIESFKIGRRRYVVLSSLDSLPERLRDREAA